MAMELVKLNKLEDDAIPEQLANITQREWDEVKRMVLETHTAITEVAKNVAPALQQLQSGGIMGLLGMGRKS